MPVKAVTAIRRRGAWPEGAGQRRRRPLPRDVGATVAGQPQRFLVPVGRGLVVDHRFGAHFLQAFGLRGRTRGRDHARAEHFRELQGEDRHAARAQDLYDVAGSDVADLDQRMPGREAGAGQGRPFLEAHARGQLDHAVLFEHGELRQHAVDRAAHRRGLCRLVDRAADPFLHEAAGDPVAHLDPADAGADRDHLAGAV
jgi:hypothetical protein